MPRYDQDLYYSRIEDNASDMKKLCDDLQAERDEAQDECKRLQAQVEDLKKQVADFEGGAKPWRER